VGKRRRDKSRGKARAAPLARVAVQILFDISDLVYYIGHHPNLTGIQRVQSSVVLSILERDLLPRSQIVFLSFDASTRSWVSIPAEFLETLLKDLLLPATRRSVGYAAEEARIGLLPGAQPFNGSGALDTGSPSVLCLLGAAWVHQDYMHRVLELKRQFGTRFVMMVHDLIPIYARETCDQGTVVVFDDFMRRALRHADHILSVSEHTAQDIRQYAHSIQIGAPPITVTRNGSSFSEFLPSIASVGGLRRGDIPKRFVLFVGTIEGRKNHQLLLDVWQRMISEGDDPPHLVCVGRLGWRSSNFIRTLVETNYLGGKILLLRDVSDSDLRLLYEKCLFTVFPTLYEGWGLTVGEALSLGKICVCSTRASVPEVAGDLGVYADIDDFQQWLRIIRELIANDAARRKLEGKIRRCYVPITWGSVAEKIIAACLSAPQQEWKFPYPYAAVPLASEISFGRLDGDTDGTGEMLLARILDPRKGIFLGHPLDERSFLLGEDVRSDGIWSAPENWGCWACYGGGGLDMAFPPDSSQVFYICLRLRVVGPLSEESVQIYGNGDLLWEGKIGGGSSNLLLQVCPKLADESGWQLHLRVQTNLTPELIDEISAIDSRVPTIGFERLVVVPENDLKTRLDVLYRLLLS
jgi:glycosyltransferase involved in cell wall biosynthesis